MGGIGFAYDVPPILAYFKDLKPLLPSKSTKKEKADFTKLRDQLERLKAVLDIVPATQGESR